jgi:hypothetical protein
MATAAGFIIISYEFLSRQNGWPVGKLYRNTVFQFVFGGLSILGAVGFAFVQVSPLWGLGVLVLGWILAFALSVVLKSSVQWAALILLVVSWGLQFFI